MELITLSKVLVLNGFCSILNVFKWIVHVGFTNAY